MFSQAVQTMALAIVITALLCPPTVLAKRSKPLNPIDSCWRSDPHWHRHRDRLAGCSVGFAGKMTNNMGRGVVHYKVMDPSDDPLNPKPGTLRYGATVIRGKVWITFQRDMNIKLEKPLLVSSYTAIDGRNANVEISDGACITLQKVNNVIIHGLRIHHCRSQPPGQVMGPDGIQNLGHIDGDAIRLVSSSKVWLDHNTLYSCQDGLIDVTRGSTDVTISNNWFREQNKVMLLGHDDGYLRDKNMKVTVAFNYFGPDCHQRMPRVRHGYAHVVNNLYQGWGLYAIGGSMNPSVTSESNLFVAPEGKKEVTWKKNYEEGMSEWRIHSVKDVFENGACFDQTGGDKGGVKPHYTHEQAFAVADARSVRSLTRYSGALKCFAGSRC
ncbi:Pectate lyase 2 precursor [Actinidia chinensis var. chinensis]|uniref:Pectate lyase n=1 Tax=Actinidia chinensis var. chinensis TaxID=1590841 RepID=A0A2R6RSP2_ACTCC|nr:Pectate lyase 2 precursor [Actinidia chinensis var. chinensis]